MQGFNMGRYVPPDLEGVASGNQLHRKPAQKHRDGAPVVRFEMPFAVWCSTCAAHRAPTLIAQGVRFNAEKRRVGSYYTTPVWAFRMAHPDCGGTLEIRTDPQNTAYVVAAGATRRDTGVEDGVGGYVYEGGDLHQAAPAVLTEAEREALRRNAFAQLERTIKDREAVAVTAQRIDELAGVAARQWRDTGAQNERLRATFREERHRLERAGAVADELASRMGLGIELAPESEADARRAALVDFGRDARYDGDDELATAGERAMAKPLFDPGADDRVVSKTHTSKNTQSPASTASVPAKNSLSKAAAAATRRREALVAEIGRSSRATAGDPFRLVGGWRDGGTAGSSRSASPAAAQQQRLGIKRKRASIEEKRLAGLGGGGADLAGIGGADNDYDRDEGLPAAKVAATASLVDYDSG